MKIPCQQISQFMDYHGLPRLPCQNQSKRHQQSHELWVTHANPWAFEGSQPAATRRDVNRRPDQAQNYNAQRVGFPQIDREGIFRGQKEASNHGKFVHGDW
jgi:hypothetical protein